MDLGLKNKIALVTASSKGLGKAIAFGLAEEGAKLTICARHLDFLEKTTREIRKKTKAEVLYFQADVSNPRDVKRLVKKATSYFGGLDILVNNAGGPPPGTFETLKDDEFQKALELSLLSTVNLCREAIPFMKKKKWGRIINMTSVAVKQPVADLILSNMARTAVIGFAKTLSVELAPYNILVNNIATGIIATDRIKKLAQVASKKQGIIPREYLERLKKEIPLGRLGKPEELSNLVVFLASNKASFITGTTIQVDGGFYKGLQ